MARTGTAGSSVNFTGHSASSQRNRKSLPRRLFTAWREIQVKATFRTRVEPPSGMEAGLLPAEVVSATVVVVS